MHKFVIILQLTICYLSEIRCQHEVFHHQIVAGDCENALLRDMVYHEKVTKIAVPLIKRDALTAWCGDEVIYCLKIVNEMDNLKSSAVAAIRYGGVGHSYVAVDMQSQQGKGIDFLITIFGKARKLKEYGLENQMTSKETAGLGFHDDTFGPANLSSTEGFISKIIHLVKPDGTETTTPSSTIEDKPKRYIRA